MSQAYYCKVCGKLDIEGIDGHATLRCKPVHKVAHSEHISSQPSEQMVTQKVLKRAAYGSKDKEARKAYRREWMRNARRLKLNQGA